MNIRNRKSSVINASVNAYRKRTSRSSATLQKRRKNESSQRNGKRILNAINNTKKVSPKKIPPKIMSLLKRLVSNGNTKNMIRNKVKTAKNMYNQNEKKKQQLLKKFRSGLTLENNEYKLLISLHKYNNVLPDDLKKYIVSQYPSKNIITDPIKIEELKHFKIRKDEITKFLPLYDKCLKEYPYASDEQIINCATVRLLQKRNNKNSHSMSKRNPLTYKEKVVLL
jgi:hypothetical protein